jgi:DNA modification methylase
MENIIFNEDCRVGLRKLPDKSVDCCVTSPPYYGLRNYGMSEQIGLEETPELYISQLVEIFTEVKRILKPKGTLWVNIGESYAGSGRGKGDINKKGIQQKASYVGDFIKPYRLNGYKNKDLIGIPWLLAFALRDAGWYLRQDIIWAKPNPMPESIKDRCTKSHEYIFLLSKSAKYHFDHEAIQTETAGTMHDKTSRKGNKTYPTELINGMRNSEGYYPKANKRDVWTVNTAPEPEAHFACFPKMLISDCIKAGCPENGIVLDPFMGSGTTAVVARKLNRKYVGFELNPDYMKIADAKLKRELGIFQ